MLCRVLAVSRSAYYCWCAKRSCYEELHNTRENLKEKLLEAFWANRRIYGSEAAKRDTPLGVCITKDHAKTFVDLSASLLRATATPFGSSASSDLPISPFQPLPIHWGCLAWPPKSSAKSSTETAQSQRRGQGPFLDAPSDERRDIGYRLAGLQRSSAHTNYICSNSPRLGRFRISCICALNPRPQNQQALLKRSHPQAPPNPPPLTFKKQRHSLSTGPPVKTHRPPQPRAKSIRAHLRQCEVVIFQMKPV